VQVVSEAAVPPCLVLAKVAAELAPAAGDVKGRISARPRAMTCWTRPVARSQTSITIAMAGSARTRAGSVAQGPVRIQTAPSSHRYQVGRTVGPLVATRAVSGWARKASTSKGGGCVTGSFSDPPRPVASRFAGGHHLARRTRVRSRSNLARSYSWRYRSGVRPPADTALLRHAEQATSGSWPEELRTWVHADGWYPAHAGRVGARLLLPTATAVGDVALVDVAGNLGGHHRGTRQRRISTTSPGPRPASRSAARRRAPSAAASPSWSDAAQRLPGPGGAGDGGDAAVCGQAGDPTGQESRSTGPRAAPSMAAIRGPSPKGGKV
jgi:hypothetical protein